MEDKATRSQNSSQSSAAAIVQPPALIQAKASGATQGVKLEAFTRFLKGGASGLLSGALLQPFQVIKTSMQISVQDQQQYLQETLRPTRKTAEKVPVTKQTLSLTARQATQFIYRKEGLTGFMRGFTPSVLKNTLNAGSYFSMLYYTETLIRGSGMFKESQVHFLASSASRTFQSIISNPLIVVKTRFEVVGFQEYSGVMDAFRQILAKEGAGGLFTGLKISLIRDVPFSGIFYPIYNMFKQYFALALGFNKAQGRGTDSSSSRTMNMAIVTGLASFWANATCCVITHPLDLIRTRVYFQYHNKDQAQHYSGLMNAFIKIYETDGMAGYFRGLLPRIARKGVGSIIAWSFYEYLIDKEDALIFA